MRIIPSYIHGILDYVVGVALLFAPNLFGFADVGGAAVIVPRLVGLLILLQAIATDYEVGILRLIPLRIHLMVDYAASLFLAASPWIFGFNTLPSNAWVPHVVVGLAVFVESMMTVQVPGRSAVDVRTGTAKNEQEPRLRKTAY